MTFKIQNKTKQKSRHVTQDKYSGFKMLKLLSGLVRNYILPKNGVGELGYSSQILACYLGLLIIVALFVSLFIF